MGWGLGAGGCSVFLSGMDVRRIQDCIGDPTRDVDNPVLKAEQEAQVREYVKEEEKV